MKLIDGQYIVQVVSPNVETSAAITGQITVTTAGTPVQGPNVSLDNGAYISALPGNTGTVKFGTTGAIYFQLSQGAIVPAQVANLNQLWFDAATNGDKFCWLKA